MCSALWWLSLSVIWVDFITEEETLMIRRAPILLTLFGLLAWAMIGCNTGGSTEDLESTIVARVVATLEGAETAPIATQAPPEPTATPVPPEPTATPVPPEPTVTPPPEIEAEEYAVYSALIQQNPINFDLGSFIVIRDQTVSGLDQLERTLEHVHPLPPELVDSYRSRNVESYALSPSLDLEQDYALMPEEEVKRLFRDGGASWTDFRDSYPEAEGVVLFSRVGFGANEDEALVSMGFRCGDLCGAGGLYLLAKEEGTWKVREALMEWIS
jgi:hypothetical protein